MILPCILSTAIVCGFDSVDPFWGSGAVSLPRSEGIAKNWSWEKAQTGNTSPGAVVPFGWVSACAYSGAYSSGYGCSGCSSDGPAPVAFNRSYALGVTHFHHSGTGWINSFYNYLLMTPYVKGVDLSKKSRLDDEVAHPGYLAGVLTDYGSSFELTARPFAACHRWKFPSGTGVLRIDATHIGLDYEAVRLVRPDYSERIEEGVFVECGTRSWAGRIKAHGVTIFFAIRADGDIKALSCSNGKLEIQVFNTVAETFVGFSLNSADEAEASAAEAQAVGFDCASKEAGSAWRAQLERVRARFANEKDRRTFYSALYHSLTKPCTCGRGYIDFSTFWDVYKTELPLVLSLAPQTGRGILEHIMATTKTKGFSPICQIMDDTVIHKDMQATALPLFTLCDGFFRGVLTRVDYPRIKKVIEKELAHADIRGMSPTHTLDLSGACGASALVAEACGDVDFAKVLRGRAENWRSVYDPKTGLLIADGPYYEGSYWNYSFRPHPGMKARVDLAGGPARFSRLLDRFFGYGCSPASRADEFDRIRRMDHFEGLNNECDMETPFAYYWSGRSDRTAEIVDAVRRFRFADGAGGCPGNNDSGATGSWYVWNCLGIFPITGSPYYLLGTPSVDSAEVDFARGTLRIEVQRESPHSIYPAGYVINGQEMHVPWLKVSELENDCKLIFILKDRPMRGLSPVPDWL